MTFAVADAEHLARRWSAVMDCYVPRRGPTLRGIVDLVSRLGVLDHVVDLGGGTGVVSEQVRSVDPGARVTLVDQDPVMLAVARARLPSTVDVVDGDVSGGDWVDGVGAGTVGAVVAAAVLHMLGADGYRAVACQVARALRPGGVLVDWDEMPVRGASGQASADFGGHAVDVALERLGEDVPGWYRAVAALPGGTELVEERQRRLAGRPEEEALPLDERRALLHQAGFQRVLEVVRDGDNAVLVAVR